MCPGWLKWQLASDWVERAKQGSPGMKDQLMMTPCDFFPFVRGRTLWLIGDSLTLVPSLLDQPHKKSYPTQTRFKAVILQQMIAEECMLGPVLDTVPT